MPSIHVIESGDCLSSLAADYGFKWQTIWEASPNARLKDARKDPNVLLPGDEIFIPDLTLGEVSKPVDQRHRFQVDRGKTRLRIRLLWLGEPRKNRKGVLTIDGVEQQVTTDGDGLLDVPIPPGASTGLLKLTGDEGEEFYSLALGGLDPVDTISGLQHRLWNLGYDCGALDGEFGPLTHRAMQAFQGDNGLALTDEPDSKLFDALKKGHGS